MRRALMLLSVSLTACASSGACPPGRTCGGASWGGGAPSDDFLALRAAAMDGDGDDVALTAGGVRVRFDLRALGPSPRIVRAVLSLRVDARDEPGGRATVRARALVGSWTAGSADDTPRGQGSAEVSVPASMRVPVRVEVTALIAEASERGVGTADFAISSGESVRLAGPWRDLDAPRLEVASR